MSKIWINNISLEDAKKEYGIDDWAEWKCEISSFPWYYDDTEICYILEGEVVVTTDEERVTLKPGMIITFPAGLSCTWDVKNPIKKVYKFE